MISTLKWTRMLVTSECDLSVVAGGPDDVVLLLVELDTGHGAGGGEHRSGSGGEIFLKNKTEIFPPPGSDSVLEVVDIGVFALETTCVLGHHPDVGVAVAHSYTRGNSLQQQTQFMS